MKKILTVAGVMMIIYSSAFGQAKVAIGIKAGANFANTDISGSESITALHVGAFGLVKIANIGIQPEVLFSQQGAEFDANDVDLSYVNIPVMLKYYLPLGLNLQVGPQFGILTDAEVSGNNATDRFKNSDLSAAFGAGWDAPFGLQFTARYILGLSDINDQPMADELRNRTFQLSVGYRFFKLGK